MTRSVELYGRLRDLGFGDRADVDVPEDASAGDVLAALGRRVGEAGALRGSVVATEDAVLRPADRLPEAGRLAVLPPVSGG